MIKKLAVYLREFSRDAWLAPMFILLEVGCEMIQPLIMAKMIDEGINGTAGLPFILRCGAALILLACCSLFFGVRSSRHCAIATQGFGRNLRGALFRKIQTFSFNDIDRFSSASLITRLTNDVNTMQMTLGMALRMMVRTPIQLVAAFIICLSINYCLDR